MNDPRDVTSASEIQELLQTRFQAHLLDDEVLHELEDGSLLGIKANAGRIAVTHYPPGWRDGFADSECGR